MFAQKDLAPRKRDRFNSFPGNIAQMGTLEGFAVNRARFPGINRGTGEREILADLFPRLHIEKRDRRDFGAGDNQIELIELVPERHQRRGVAEKPENLFGAGVFEKTGRLNHPRAERVRNEHPGRQPVARGESGQFVFGQGTDFIGKDRFGQLLLGFSGFALLTFLFGLAALPASEKEEHRDQQRRRGASETGKTRHRFKTPSLWERR